MTDESSNIQSRYHALKQQFCAGLPARLEQIHTLGYNWLDTEPQQPADNEFLIAVHKLAGSAGSFDFPEISTLCQKMENAIRENDHASGNIIRTWLDQLQAFIK